MAPALLLCALLSTILAASQTAAAHTTSLAEVTLSAAQTAGISGFDWDATFPGATVVDAVHRSVLVRFPGSAEALAKEIGKGLQIEHARVLLEYDGYEIVPLRYLSRPAQGEGAWKANPPRWHVVAWPLRRPWTADKQTGPTFNAFINGAGYWGRYGAADTTSDRYSQMLGPAELSYAAPSALIDVTQILTGSAFGNSLGERLRRFDENGLLLRKWESYDSRYRDQISYEWAVPTGGHGLRFRNARLQVSFTPAQAPSAAAAALPPATDLAALGRTRQAGPTATMPSAEDLRQIGGRLTESWRTALAPEQRQRVMELYRIGGDRVSPFLKAAEAGDYGQYRKLIGQILAIPPRYWQGWDIQDDLLVWHLYRPLLPSYVQDHMRAYWESWLMPDVATRDMLPPQGPEPVEYWRRTQDWRGRSSFFRGGFNYGTSTQNFNHTAAMGALLGGDLVGSANAIADGRHGLEHFPLRLWALRDGSTQEMLDHYYFSITLSAQKMFADFGPEPRDRLMGRIMLDRSLELLASTYHPLLRRMVSASGRARLPGILVEQDAVYTVLHTLSGKGTLNYLDQPFDAKVRGMPVWGYDVPPGRVAMQTLPGAWGPEWFRNIIDDKALPFEETSTETTRGAYDPPLWRRTYLGRYYGLASQDIKGGTADVLAQWTRVNGTVTRMEDLGTLTLRYAVNTPDMATTAGGGMPNAGGLVTFQHRNRAIVCTKPRTEKDAIVKLAGKDGLTSLASVIALWNFRPAPDWELYVDGSRVALPARIRAGQVIAIRDGPSYIGIVPLPATDLGRTDEVVIGAGGGGKAEPNGAAISPALTIVSYNLQRDKTRVAEPLDWEKITTGAYGGFVIELGDSTEYRTFDEFVQRMRTNRVTTRSDPGSHLLHVEYRSGRDLLEMGCATHYAQADVHYGVVPGQQSRAVPYRRVNGGWPYLAPGIERDSAVAQQGTSGRLEKNGTVLVTDKGRKAYLIVDPVGGTSTGYNPLPDSTQWSMQLPGNVAITASGPVGLLRVSAQPRVNRITVDHAPEPNAPAADTQLIVTGFGREPAVILNGQPLRTPLRTSVVDGRTAYVVPLGR